MIWLHRFREPETNNGPRSYGEAGSFGVAVRVWIHRVCTGTGLAEAERLGRRASVNERGRDRRDPDGSGEWLMVSDDHERDMAEHVSFS